MHRTCLVAVAIIALTNGCSQAAEHTPTENHSPTHSRMFEVAEQEAQERGGVLVAFSQSIIKSGSYAVFVTYSEATERDPATCRLQILEGVAGAARIVEETDHLLFCSTVVDAESERKQLSVNASKGTISIHEQRDKKNSTFELINDEGGWVVSKVAFIYPGQETNAAEMELIKEEGSFPGSMARTRVSDFNARSANLVRKVIR